MSNVTELFMKLVQIDSVSGEEEQIAKYIKNYLLSQCNLTAQVDKYHNVFVQTAGNQEPVLFSAHTDTVEPGRGIIPILKNGVITSRGPTILGADDKSAVAAILSALQHMSANPSDNWKPVDVIFSSAEETNSSGSIGFDKTKIRSKIGYIFDGTGPVGSLMSASPYYASFDILIKGKHSHAGYPENAVPAIPDMMELIRAIYSIMTKDVLINIGQVSGGNARNTIIGSITLQGEIRCFYKNKFEKAIEKIKKILAKKYLCTIESSVRIENPGYIFSDDELAPIKSKIEQLLGKEIAVNSSFGVSDANIYNENPKILKVFNLGDGSTGAHTTQESTTVEALETMRDLILKLSKNEVQNNV